LLTDTRDTVVTYSDWEIKYGAGRLFTPGGRVFDPIAGTNIATGPYSGLVAPDETDWRVFYLTGSGSTWTLSALSITNLALVNSVTITNVSGSPTRLIRWGTDGLAFRTTGGQIFLIRTILADDRNNNGLPDSWELQYFGSLDAPGNGPNDDPDGDGFTNLQEYQAGLNPLLFDPPSFTRSSRLPDGRLQFSVLGNVGKSFALLASTNLADWTPILKFTCTNIPTLITDPASTNFSRRFYRVAPLSIVPGPSLVFLSAQALGTNNINLALNGVPGFTYRIETSSNLSDWTTLTNFISTTPVMNFQDQPATADRKFYRAIAQ
jgi:hypothetical protein